MDTLASKTRPRDIDKALQTLPHTFEGIYDEALRRMDDQPKDRRELAYRALSWISHAFRPLSFMELRCALAVEEDMNEGMDETDLVDAETLISVCAGLVTVNEGSREVGLVRKYPIHHKHGHHHTHKNRLHNSGIPARCSQRTA
jgi:hypothetical protein